ncbi:hypothetical protein EX30DRAFT_349991 [Ascodesmis nigricans]|uniref:BZIP domain-containing protein n=1 Tax=Ascodesmis nigricans TaxID=341454 RepID=A0A4S2MTE8_9PEZI|nr:hypothetical protein EX30DRAFT_349991 [Ascodesmis nigricans]
MSSNAGRRGLNVTSYLQNLNMPLQEDVIDAYNPADDLSLWADTTFFDFDLGMHVQRTSTEEEERKPTVIDPSLKEAGAEFDFLNDLHSFEPSPFDYNPGFAEFTDHQQLHSVSPTVVPQIHTPAPPPQQHPQATHSHVLPKVSPITAPSSLPSTPAVSAAPTRTVKRKASAISSPASSDASPQHLDLEEESRRAAEEDKRRRNTAASARFRIKKKQKEQQLEKTAREMSERVAILEQRIQTLEMENKWLKNLIVEKNGGKSGEEIMQPQTPGMKEDGEVLVAA